MDKEIRIRVSIGGEDKDFTHPVKSLKQALSFAELLKKYEKRPIVVNIERKSVYGGRWEFTV